jgi:hypothetical protein
MCEEKRRASRECHTDLRVVGGERKPSRGRAGEAGTINEGMARQHQGWGKKELQGWGVRQHHGWGGKATSWMEGRHLEYCNEASPRRGGGVLCGSTRIGVVNEGVVT